MEIASFVRESAERFSASDGLVLFLALVTLYGIRKAPKGQFFDDPLNRGQGLALRGFFACVVMFCHLSDRVVFENGFLFPRFDLWGSFAVSVFFGLSGYGLMLQSRVRKNYLDGFWHRRFQTLLWPYLIVSLLAFAQWCRGDYAMGYRMGKWLGIVSYGWYCTVVFLFYVAFWWGNRRQEHKTGERLALTIAGILLITVLSAFANFRDFHFESNGAFIAGLLFGAYRANGCKLLGEHWWKLLVFTCVIVSTRLSWGLARWAAPGLRTNALFILHMFWFTGIVALSMKWQFGNRILAWLGTISYELYLIHGWVIDEIAHWWPEWKGPGCAWVIFVASLFLAWGMHEAVEKWKHRFQAVDP